MCEEEARGVQMSPVEKAAPVLSGPVGGSVSYVLGSHTVVLGDGGVSSGIVGMKVYVGDVSGGGDTDVSGVDTVVSCAVSRICLCDLDRVSVGGDMKLCRVDAALSGAVGGSL